MPPETDPVPLKHRELERIAMVALKAARMLLESGARVKVVHEGAALIVKGLGVDIVGKRAGYASHEITVSHGANTITRMTTVGPHGVNHRLDHALRALCVRVSQGGMSIDEIEAEMDGLVAQTPRYHPPSWRWPSASPAPPSASCSASTGRPPAGARRRRRRPVCPPSPAGARHQRLCHRRGRRLSRRRPGGLGALLATAAPCRSP